MITLLVGFTIPSERLQVEGKIEFLKLPSSLQYNL